MKLTNIFKLLLITLAMASCGETPLEKGKYRINGTVSGLDNGEIYMFNYPKTDTIKVINGKFEIENDLKDKVGSIALAKVTSQRESNKENYLSLFVEPAIMSLVLNYEDFSISKLVGSSTQDDQYRLDDIRNEVALDYKEEQDAYEAVRKKYAVAAKAGASEEELEVIKYEDNEAKDKLSPLWEEQNKMTLQFIKDNPKSFVSVHSLFFLLGDIKYEEAKTLFDQFNPEHLKIGFGAELTEHIESMLKGVPGTIAGNFDTIDINGNPLKLADFKGKHLLIDFWASWCVPCRKGNPHLISLYKKYNPKGLEILGVSNDDSEHDKWRRAVEKDQIDIWHHVLRGTKMVNGRPDFSDKSTDISDGYNINSLPTKILINPEGIIIGRYGRGGGTDADMDRDLAKLFN